MTRYENNNKNIKVSDIAILNGERFTIVGINFPYIQIQKDQLIETIQISDIGKENRSYTFDFLAAGTLVELYHLNLPIFYLK